MNSAPERARRIGLLPTFTVLGVALLLSPGILLGVGELTPPSSSAPNPEAAGPPPGIVRLANRTIATLRAPVLGNSPVERARAVNVRLEALVERRGWGEVVVRDEPYGKAIVVNGLQLFVVTPGDVDTAREETQELVAGRAAEALTKALAEAQEARSLPDLVEGILLSLLAAFLFVVVLLGIEKSRRWLANRAVAAAQRRAKAAGIPGAALLESDHVYVITTRALLLAGRTLELVWGYLCLAFILRRFPYTRPWGEELRHFLFSTLKQMGLGVLGWMPNLFVVAVIFFLTRFLLRLVAIFFRAVEDGRIEVNPTLVETAQPTKKLLNGIVWVFALIMAYPYLPGSSSEAFKGISVMVGLMVSLGSTALIGQLASGFQLMYSRTFRVGHYIRVGDIEGTVLTLGLFATKVRTTKGEEVSIPNTVIVGTTTLNYSRSPDSRGVVLYTNVTIGYDTPWRQVEGLLIRAADRTAGLKRDPRPFVLQRSLGDFYIDYELNAVIERPETRIQVLAELHANIQDSFNEFGVQIMSPHYMFDPKRDKVVPREKWFEPPARQTASRNPGDPGGETG